MDVSKLTMTRSRYFLISFKLLTQVALSLERKDFSCFHFSAIFECGCYFLLYFKGFYTVSLTTHNVGNTPIIVQTIFQYLLIMCDCDSAFFAFFSFKGLTKLY